MAKYTMDDPDVQFLDDADRMDYNYAMLDYDADKYREIYLGSETVRHLSNSEKMSRIFESPEHFSGGVTAACAAALSILLLTMFIMWLLYKFVMQTDSAEIKARTIEKVFWYVLVLSVLVALIYFMLNRTTLYITKAAYAARQSS
jgi:hypothetical protein